MIRPGFESQIPNPESRQRGTTRRDFLSAALLAPAAFLPQQPEARLVGTVPLGNPTGGPTTPLERLVGRGLSARLFTDLSTLSASPVASGSSRTRLQEEITPNERFFIRTAAPESLPEKLDATSWSIDVGGLVASPAHVTVASLEPLVTRGGRYLLECSGNTDPANYGLLSAADWDGVPLAALLDRVKPSAALGRVLVAGVDDAADPAGTSVPGASWIFSRDELSRALLATRMNGAPLPRDHGFPVRLIVPGWYGCACIKWVNRIDLVTNDAPPTSQMREFAARTHQRRMPTLARDFTPAVIDTAAMPVRVEKWAANGRIFYRVVGIIWGGTASSGRTNALSIRFRSNLPWTQVEEFSLAASTDTWSAWTHTWRPDSPGRYTIVLRVEDPRIRTRRLDIFFYARDSQIDEI